MYICHAYHKDNKTNLFLSILIGLNGINLPLVLLNIPHQITLQLLQIDVSHFSGKKKLISFQMRKMSLYSIRARHVDQ
jgi:hypothetical protein